MKVTFIKGGSGRWVAYEGERPSGRRLGSGHVPSGAPYPETAIVQLRRQLGGERDPGHHLGGGQVRTLDV